MGVSEVPVGPGSDEPQAVVAPAGEGLHRPVQVPGGVGSDVPGAEGPGAGEVLASGSVLPVRPRRGRPPGSGKNQKLKAGNADVHVRAPKVRKVPGLEAELPGAPPIAAGRYVTDEQIGQLISEVQTRTVTSVLGTLRQLGVDLDMETGKLSISQDLIQSQIRAMQPSRPQPMNFVQPLQPGNADGVRALPIPAEVMQAQAPPTAAEIAANQSMLAQANQARFMPPPGLPASNPQPFVQRLSPPPPPAPPVPQDPGRSPMPSCRSCRGAWARVLHQHRRRCIRPRQQFRARPRLHRGHLSSGVR